MELKYSIYEAKAKLSEIIRHVKRRRSVTITERGREVARVVPSPATDDFEQRLAELVSAGVVTLGDSAALARLPTGKRRRGALERFLADRGD